MAKKADWPLIRTLYEQGASPERISEQMGGYPTARGVKVVATRERWEGSKFAVHRNSKATPEARTKVLEALRQGATYSMAAACAGVTRQALSLWRRDIEDFQVQCDAAVAEFAGRQIRRIDAAADADWKASSYLLSHHPETRPDWAPQVSKGSGGLNVVINIPRQSIDAPTGTTYEHDASLLIEADEA